MSASTPPPPPQPLPLPRATVARLEAVLSIGAHLIPHPRKAASGGEDAFFANSDAGGVFAIADGVSGWAEKNVNPALFSRELMRNSSNFLNDEAVSHDPQILLMKAHAATSSIGSATVIIAMLEKTGTLKIASVGDCGLKVIRKGQVMFSISPQEHYFDCPYQISSEAEGQTYKDALVCSVNLMEGDIIVSGSDGLFDNIFDQEIVSIISESPSVDEAAKALAELARKHSVDVRFDSPYSMEARSRGFDVPWWKKLLGGKLIGGKMDDITVVVAQVKTVVVPEDEVQGGDTEEQKGNEQGAAAVVAYKMNDEEVA
ncbi:probable protein phosphatase 2C 1 isoform X1 [Zea mays]|uniref:Protein phosphatase n=1 Tax=Zea mays TaxID=4577 RepID=A0A804MZL7_MAIZE|nr:uncharacterized protein LOC10028208 isoform X1 [Zea mays]|eukprot:XP_008672857.1 protein phosphatase 2C isoform X1 [Zea mays]